MSKRCTVAFVDEDEEDFDVEINNAQEDEQLSSVPEQYRREYECQFADHSGDYFSPDQLQRLEGHLANRWELDLPEGHPYANRPSEMSRVACRIDTECEFRQNGCYYSVRVLDDRGDVMDIIHTVNYEQSLEAEAILAQRHCLTLPEDHPQHSSTVSPEYRIDTECVHADGINWYIVRVFNQNGDMIVRRQVDSRDSAIEIEMMFAERYNTTPPPAYPAPRATRLDSVRHHDAEECNGVYIIDPDDDTVVHVFNGDVNVALPTASEVEVGRIITIVNRGNSVTHVSDGNEWFST